MRFRERIQAWLRREGADAQELLDDTTRRLDEDLARRERELSASPEERMELLGDRIAENDAELDALRARIERQQRDEP